MSFSRSKYLSASILMTEPSATTRTSSSRHPLSRSASLALRLAALSFLLATSAHAQISLTTAVDLALRNSPRVRLATADVDKARAALAEVHDVYIPSILAGSGLGYAYGVPVSPPSAFNITAQSLAYTSSQRDYIRASQAGLDAANLTLMDVRQQVAEDTTVTYIALDYDIERLSRHNHPAGLRHTPHPDRRRPPLRRPGHSGRAHPLPPHSRPAQTTAPPDRGGPRHPPRASLPPHRPAHREPRHRPLQHSRRAPAAHRCANLPGPRH